MRTFLVRDGAKRPISTPFEGADHAVLEGATTCPACGSPAPVKLAGDGRRVAGHDAWEADAYALCCRERVGTIRAEASTIFGVEEDERVLNGRARVY